MDARSLRCWLLLPLLVAGLVWGGPVQAATLYFAHTDAQGSVVAVTDSTRQVVERREYEPYGLPRAPVSDDPGYTGHVHDADSGLVYMQQRYYDPEVGRFLSLDPVGVSAATGANFNRYWYANNNPYTFVDPDGQLACDENEPECRRKLDQPAWPGGPTCRQVCLGGSGVQATERKYSGAVGAIHAFRDMVQTMDDYKEITDWVWSLEPAQAAILARGLGWDGYADSLSNNPHPAILTVFQHEVTSMVNTARFRRQVNNIGAIGRGLTEAAIERRIFSLARSRAGKDVLRAAGVPPEAVSAIGHFRTFDEYRQLMQVIRE